MSRTTITATFAAVLAASMPAAFAQTVSTTPPSATTTLSPSATNHLMPGQVRFTEMNGATIYDAHNKNIGDIKDVVLDRDGRVAAVVLDVGSFLGIGGKNVAVAESDIKVTTDSNGKLKFTVDTTKDQLTAAPAFDLSVSNASIGSSIPPANHERK